MLLASANEGAYAGISHFLKEALGLEHLLLLDPIWVLLAAGLPLTWITVHGFFAIWLERKVSAHIQCRLGPMDVGGFHGWAQTIADGVKLLAKEDIIPRAADKPLFIAAPIIAFAATFALFLVLPFGGVVDTDALGLGMGSFKLTACDLPLGIFFIAAVGSMEAIGVILAGWASNNKWSLFGAMRTATQVVSYEIPLGIGLLAVVLVAGDFSMYGISEQQAGWFWNWYVFRSPFLFLTFFVLFVCDLAETKRAPFDLPEAESELVCGFHTEYSGMRFSIFFLAEYSAMYAVGVMTAVLFLGGYHTGIPMLDTLPAPLLIPLQAFTMLTKGLFFVFVMIWLRWTLPRVRLDHVMHVCLKVLVPFAMVGMIGSAIWEMTVGPYSLYWAVPFSIVCVITAAVLLIRLISLSVAGREVQYA